MWTYDPLPCAVCGGELPKTKRRGEPWGGRGRQRRYCSEACKQKAKRERAKTPLLAGLPERVGR